ncbi:MAG: amino acid--tRNA ligase-related protein [Solitalea-like symbiont of Acarus siro]
MFNSYNGIEIDTPILHPIHGGAAARPLQTFHNDRGINLFLRIANELYLKRMIVAGFDGVYEIGKMFRNEGIDKTHNPEFTSVELYVAYHDYIWMMEIVEKLLEYITLHIHKTSVVTINGKQIDFKGPYKKISMLDAIKQYTDIDVSNLTTPELQTVCKKLKIEIDTRYSSAKLIDLIFSKYVEPHLIEPTFIIDHPIETTPLAKKHRDNAKLAERFELFINKKEIANDIF